MARGMSLSQKHALIAAYKIHPHASFKAHKDVRDSLVELGYCIEARVPLVRETGIKLTAAGIAFARDGIQIERN